MRLQIGSRQLSVRSLALLMALVFGGCYFGYWSYVKHGGGKELRMGEEHEADMSKDDAFVMVQDVLRSEGLLYETNPDDSIITDWQHPDVKADSVGSLLGVNPQYRYEIQVLPAGSHKSKIVANVHTEDMPEDRLATYKPSAKLQLFEKFDQLAAQTPPPSQQPAAGGVNYALLPNEDLKGLALRVTGDENNWLKIAADNGAGSPTDVGKLQTIWVRNSLIKHSNPSK